ncbi:unnamed protein product [Toxocara canis]|uniref:Uncharacterized protein n=1 Tax=Toxocara canis TaxID=6265 RepID=A0A183U6H2_TOXCA|nr:unnamed protein product [Toxocara canis]
MSHERIEGTTAAASVILPIPTVDAALIIDLISRRKRFSAVEVRIEKSMNAKWMPFIGSYYFRFFLRSILELVALSCL